MKLKNKILLGFSITALIALISGLVGIISLETVIKNSDMIIAEKVPVKDATMESVIMLISGRDASAEYMLNSETCPP